MMKVKENLAVSWILREECGSVRFEWKLSVSVNYSLIYHFERMEVRQELLFNVTTACNNDENNENCSWSCLLGMENGSLSFPWATTSLWAERASKRFAIGVALLIISTRSLWNLSLTCLKSSQRWRNAQPVALLTISACSQAMNLKIRKPMVF